MVAGCWQDAALDHVDLLQTINGNRSSAVEHWNKTWPLFVERFGGSLSSTSLEIGEKIVKHCAEIVQTLAASPITLCQGDLRADNLLLSNVDMRFFLVDWQGISRVPAAMDIAEFFTSSLPVDERRRDGAKLLDLYHEALIDAGVKSYSHDLYMRDISLASAYKLLICLGRWLRDMPIERLKRLVPVWIKRTFAMIEDHQEWRDAV